MFTVAKFQDLWRHVVPKKRHSAISERPSVPSTPLLPPASVNEHRAENSLSKLFSYSEYL